MSIEVARYRLATMDTPTVAWVDRVESLRSIDVLASFEEEVAISMEILILEVRTADCSLYVLAAFYATLKFRFATRETHGGLGRSVSSDFPPGPSQPACYPPTPPALS